VKTIPDHVLRDPAFLDRFWSAVHRSGDGCWLWQLSCNPKTGYGQFVFKQVHYAAHRVAYQIAHGPIPSGVLVRHKCDVRACCRPDHLLSGTYLDNARDMAARGRCLAQAHPERVSRGDAHYSRRRPERLARGDRHGARLHPEQVLRGSAIGTSKLLECDVRVIKEALAVGVSLADIARGFDIHYKTVAKIRDGRTWRHVP
jgi:hypothetical protein